MAKVSVEERWKVKCFLELDIEENADEEEEEFEGDEESLSGIWKGVAEAGEETTNELL